jgi:hypothetical protein
MCPKSKLVTQVRTIITTPVPVVRALAFMFSPTEAAAYHNLAIFKNNNFDYTQVMRSQQGSKAWYGSEFRSLKLLGKIFANHETLGHMHPILSGGGSLPLKEIDGDIYQVNNDLHVERGSSIRWTMTCIWREETISRIKSN